MKKYFVVVNPLKGVVVKCRTAAEADRAAEEMGPGTRIENPNGAAIQFCEAIA